MKPATLGAAPARLQLLELLGRGGMAEAWLARWTSGGRAERVCAKRARPGCGATARGALVDEARILSRVRHANVVRYRALHRAPDGEPLLVLDLIDGADLGRVLEHARARGLGFTPGAVAWIAAELCRALAACQAALPGGLVHRDLTPHNVLISRAGQVTLGDFGLARAPTPPRPSAPERLAGKPRYLAPEQIHGGALDPRTDLHAVGLVAAELLSGRRPFAELSASAALARLRAGDAPTLLHRAPRTPPGLAAALHALLRPLATDRPPDALAAALLLAPWADEASARATLSRLASAAGLARAARPRSHVGRSLLRPSPWTVEASS